MNRRKIQLNLKESLLLRNRTGVISLLDFDEIYLTLRCGHPTTNSPSLAKGVVGQALINNIK